MLFVEVRKCVNQKDFKGWPSLVSEILAGRLINLMIWLNLDNVQIFKRVSLGLAVSRKTAVKFGR